MNFVAELKTSKIDEWASKQSQQRESRSAQTKSSKKSILTILESTSSKKKQRAIVHLIMDSKQVQEQYSDETNNSALPVELAQQLVSLVQAAHCLS